jgi:hypothetical protein
MERIYTLAAFVEVSPGGERHRSRHEVHATSLDDAMREARDMLRMKYPGHRLAAVSPAGSFALTATMIKERS